MNDTEFDQNDRDDDVMPEGLLELIQERYRIEERKMLTEKHGQEKADEILLNRELGELTYEMDVDE